MGLSTRGVAAAPAQPRGRAAAPAAPLGPPPAPAPGSAAMMPAPPALSQPLGAAAGPAWAQGWDEGSPWMRVPRQGRGLGAEPRHHRPVSTASRLAGDPGDLGRGCPRATPVPSSAPAAAPARGAEPPGLLVAGSRGGFDVCSSTTCGTRVCRGGSQELWGRAPGGVGLPVTPRCWRGPRHAGTGTPVSPGAHGLVHGCVTWPALRGPDGHLQGTGTHGLARGGVRAFRASTALAVALSGLGACGAGCGGCVLQRCRAAGSLWQPPRGVSLSSVVQWGLARGHGVPCNC